MLVPGRPVGGQDRPRGTGGSFRTSSVLVSLRRGVSGEAQAPRGAAPGRGVPAMGEVRQAGGAGVLGAVACRGTQEEGCQETWDKTLLIYYFKPAESVRSLGSD